MLNLDTHILLYALLGGNELSRRERALLAKARWGISAIVLWEIAKLHQKGRITLSLDHPMLVQALAQVEIWPLSREVCLNLSALDFRSDPADELIVATSITYRVPLLTRDERIRVSKAVKIAH
jgi:PIN domain nuclease of toxin-antitoxin system